MLKRILSLFLIVILAVVPVATIWVNPPKAEDISSLENVEKYLRENFVFGEELKAFSTQLLLQSGQKEQNNIFYTEDGLLENYWPAADETVMDSNIKAITDFAQKHDIPVGVVVVPTAAAVKQKLVPDNAPLYNQKEAIAEIYRQMEGKVTAADVYSTLYQNYDAYDEYLYYHTTSGLTSLGGYRVYEAIGERLRLAPLPLNRYSKQYLVHDYYGDLADSWGKKRAEGDILAAYSVVGDKKIYQLQVTDLEGNQAEYETMYPLNNMENNPFSIFLGGESSGFKLKVQGGKNDRSLLIFGDKTVQSVAPFLSQHYENITYYNLEQTERRTLRRLDLSEYEQVIFLYGIESFCDSQSIHQISVIP